MTKKIIISLVVTLALVVGFINVSYANEKIALVSLQQALNEVNEGKKAKQGLQKEYETKKKKIDEMKTDLESMSQDLEKQQMVLSAEAMNQKRKELQTKFMDLQNKAATFERELKNKEAQSAQKILNYLRQIVVSVAQTGGYTLVLENSAETVLYSKGAEDITKTVIAEYNKGNYKK
ncbi:MAG: OmpH family outer membrane protein [bacterium]|nr:OmpH family outer membrane protein [bacterium]MBU1916612.1 OmpH family outer membrane protein [bacterium]